MSHKHGTYLGGVRDLETLRDRCSIDHDTHCWRLRQPRTGRPLTRGDTPKVFVHGAGKWSALRFAWLCAHPDDYARVLGDRDVRVIHTDRCMGHDCVNPEHLRLGSSADSWKQARRMTGPRFGRDHLRGVRRVIANHPSTKLNPELVRWARESGQRAADVAHGLGVSKSRVIAIRKRDGWPHVA